MKTSDPSSMAAAVASGTGGNPLVAALIANARTRADGNPEAAARHVLTAVALTAKALGHRSDAAGLLRAADQVLGGTG